MAINSQIDLILRAVFKGEEEFKRAQVAVARVLGSTEQLGNEATRTGNKQEQALQEAKKKAEQLAKAFDDVRSAEKLVAESKGTEQEADAIKLLAEEQKKLAQIIERNSTTDSTANKKRLSEIQQLQTQLSRLVAKQRELQSIGNRSQAQNNELSTVNAQIAGLQSKITALRAGTNALAQQTTTANQSLGQLASNFQQINSFAPQSVQGLGAITNQIVNVGKALGATGAIAAGFLGITTAVTSALINQAEVTAKNAKVAQEIQKSTGATAGFIGALTSVITSYGGEIQNVQELLLQVGSVINQAIAEPTGTTAEKFERLGVAFRDVTGRARNAEQVIKDIDKAAKETGLTTEQLAIVSTIFGEEASKQFLGRLGELDDLQKALEKTGAILSEELTAKAQEFNKSGQFLQALVTGLSQSLSGELFDALTRINELTSEVLQDIDPTSLDALRSLIQDLGRGLVATAETGAKAFQLLFEGIDVGTATVIPGLADFAAATSAILNPLDTLNFLLTGNSPVAEKANQSNKKLVETFTAGTFAADALSKKIKQLADDQNFLAQISEITANQRIAFIQEEARLGIKSEQDAKREIDKIEDEKLAKQTDNAFTRLTKVKESLQQETKVKENEAKQQVKIEEDSKNKRIALEQEIEKFKRESFERQFSANGKDIASQKRAEEIKQQDNATLSIKLKNLEALRLAEATASENSKKAEKELSDFKLALNLNEIIDERKLSEDKLKAREQLKTATLELRKAEEAQNNKNLEQRKNDEKSILADRKTTIDGIEEEEKALTTKLAKQLAEQKINQEQFNQQTLAEKISFAQRRLKVEEEVLAKLNASENVSLQEKIAASERVEALKTQIAQDQTTQRINNSKRELDELKSQIEIEQALRNSNFEVRKLQISQIKDLNLKAIQEGLLERDIAQSLIIKALEQVALEQKTLETLKAQGVTKGELEKQQAKITTAIIESQKAAEQLRITEKKILDEKLQNAAKAIAANKAEIDSLDGRSKSFIKGLEQINDKLNQVAEFFKVTFDPKNFDLSGLQDAENQLEEFKSALEETNKELLSGFGSLSPLLQAQKIIIEESIIELENRIGEAKRKLAIENQRKANEAELAERRKGAEQALNIVEDFEEQANKIREDSFEKRQSLKQQIIDNAADGEREIADLIKDNEKELAEFDQEEKDRELERADQQHDALLQKEADFQAQLQATKDAAEQEAAKKQSQAAKKAAEIDLQLQELLEKRQQEKDPNKQKDLDEQIKKKRAELEQADKAEEDRLKREQRKQEEIKDAQEKANDKIKNAKSDTEIAEIEKELEIQLDGINKKFDNEQKFAEELAKFQGKISQERLDALKAAFDREQAAIETNTKNKLEAEKRQAELSEQIRKKAAEKEKEEIAKRRQELIDSQNQELADRRKSFEEKQKQLEEALKKERQEYKEHLDELRTKTAESLAEIAKSFSDGGSAAEKFFVDFAKNAGLTEKAIDDILKKLRQFKSEVANNDQQSANTTGSNNSTNPINNNNNNNNSNPLSSPTQGNNGGTAGSLGNFIQQQAPNQSSGEQNNNSNFNNQAGGNFNPPIGLSEPSSGSPGSPNTSVSANSNSGISPSPTSNQPNQNSQKEQQPSANASAGQKESSKKSANVPSIGEMKTAKEYRKVMIKIRDEYYKAVDLDVNKEYTLQELGNRLVRDKKIEGSLVDAQFEATGKYINYIISTVKDPEILKMLQRKSFGTIPFLSSIVNVKGVGQILSGSGKKVGDKITFKGSDKRYAKILDERIDFYEQYRGPDPEPANPDQGGGGKDAPTKDGDAESSPEGGSTNQPGGRGNNPSPRSPGSTNPVKPTIPNSGGLSDKEKAFFANRDKDANTGFDEAEASGLAGRRGLRPDAAVGGPPKKSNQGTNSTNSTNNQLNPSNQDPTSLNNVNNDVSQTQAINQNNNNEVTVNLQVQGFLGDNKTVNQLKELFSDLMSQQNQVNQDRLRQLNGANLARRG